MLDSSVDLRNNTGHHDTQFHCPSIAIVANEIYTHVITRWSDHVIRVECNIHSVYEVFNRILSLQEAFSKLIQELYITFSQ